MRILRSVVLLSIGVAIFGRIFRRILTSAPGHARSQPAALPSPPVETASADRKPKTRRNRKRGKRASQTAAR
jgi:hypothetical protein